MAFTDEQVAQWFAQNKGASEADIAKAMASTGVDPAQVARVTGADPGYVAAQYNALTTAGPPSPSANVQAAPAPTLVNVPASPQASTVAASPQALAATVQDPTRTDTYTDDQVRQWIASNPRATEAQIAEAMRVSGVTPAQVARVINAPVDLVTQRFGQYAAAPSAPIADEGIAAAIPQPTFSDQLNNLFQANLGRAPTAREADIYSRDFRGQFGPSLESAFMERSAQEMGNRAATLQAAEAAQIEAAKPPPTPREIYQPQYLQYRMPGQTPFGGYYGMPGVGPYGGVYGIGTDQFNQQINPFMPALLNTRSFMQTRGRTPYGFNPGSMMANRPMFSPLTFQPSPSGYSGYNPFMGGMNPYGASPSFFGGQMNNMGMRSNPFMYGQPTQQRASPTPTPSASRPTQSVFQGSKTAMRRGGSVDLGIAAVPLMK